MYDDAHDNTVILKVQIADGKASFPLIQSPRVGQVDPHLRVPGAAFEYSVVRKHC